MKLINLHKIYDIFINFLFPKKCVICGKYGLFFCLECFQKLDFNKTSFCPSCGRISDNFRYCKQCKPYFFLDKTIFCCYFNKEAKTIVHELKYDGIIELSNILADSMVRKIKEIKLPKNLIVTYVPISSKKLRNRGFNQSFIVAQIMSKKLNLPISKLLIKVRDHQALAKLNRIERLKSVKSTFALESARHTLLDKQNVLIVDDVYTTGSTLNECAKILKENGAKMVIGIVFAKDK